MEGEMTMRDVPDSAIDEAMDNICEKHDAPAARAVLEKIDVHHLIDRMEGRGGGLRSSKPQASGDTGLTQWVWRRCTFHSGKDASMPVMADSWLETWLDSQDDIDASVWGVKSDSEKDAGDEVKDALEDVVTLILLVYGKDPAGGAKRWKGLAF